jgi:hypothetical protein
MSVCKYCNEEIEWRKDANGKSFPANPSTGQRHDCQKKEPARHDITNPVSAPNNPAPASGIKTVEGQIVGIDYDKRLVRVKDIAGETTLIIWPASRDEPFKKQKEWWFVRITGEIVDHTFVPADVAYWKKPDNWPKPAGGSGGWKGQPRNEKPIIYQVCFKEACETVRALVLQPDKVLDEKEFNRLMDMALERAKKDAKALIEAAGVSN